MPSAPFWFWILKKKITWHFPGGPLVSSEGKVNLLQVIIFLPWWHIALADRRGLLQDVIFPPTGHERSSSGLMGMNVTGIMCYGLCEHSYGRVWIVGEEKEGNIECGESFSLNAISFHRKVQYTFLESMPRRNESVPTAYDSLCGLFPHSRYCHNLRGGCVCAPFVSRITQRAPERILPQELGRRTAPNWPC